VTQRKIPLEPVRKGKTDPKEYARRACETADWLKREGYSFADSTEIVRADRDSRV
jgi:hypothetical protein